ncbi:MAG: phosphopantothenoylcysteine decarboxylase [Bacteroidia bacterium]|nr:MAG: phosphopantothenoylcysteine decarboxylase [Bacteroidia bacterium]
MAHVLLGVTGSIAAYKAPLLVRALQKAGHEVTVILTRAAAEFVAPLTLEVLTRRPVLREIWTTPESGASPGEWTQHIALAKRADVLLIAPATAHTLARLAQGFCDDLLSAIFLATRKPVLIAPAMETEMYRHPATQANLERLRRLPHVTIIPPGKGFLASGSEGVGRLASLYRIRLAVESAVAEPLLKGKKVLLTAGATREPWDAVRFLSNGSTGQMARALAEAAYILGAETVHVLSAYTEVRFHKGLFQVTFAPTAQALFEAFQAYYAEYDWLIFAAAVSDYTFAESWPGKHKKTSEGLSLALVPTPDILAWAGEHKKPHQLLIGFALEEAGQEALAEEKRRRKKADWIAFNPITPRTGMGSPTNVLVLLGPRGERRELPLAPKGQLAREMLTFIAHASAGQP